MPHNHQMISHTEQARSVQWLAAFPEEGKPAPTIAMFPAPIQDLLDEL